MSSSFAIVRDGRYSKFQSTEAAHRRFQYSTAIYIDAKQKKFSNFEVNVVKQKKPLLPKGTIVNQSRKKFLICRREFELSQIPSSDPIDRGAFDGFRFTLGQAADEECDLDGFLRITMCNGF